MPLGSMTCNSGNAIVVSMPRPISSVSCRSTISTPGPSSRSLNRPWLPSFMVLPFMTARISFVRVRYRRARSISVNSPTISTLRFICLPDSESLLTMGSSSPKPLTMNRFGASPWTSTRYLNAAIARFSDSSWLSLRGPVESVWPLICTTSSGCACMISAVSPRSFLACSVSSAELTTNAPPLSLSATAVSRLTPNMPRLLVARRLGSSISS